MSKWIPDRKVWAGGVFAVLAYVTIIALNTYAGTDIPLDAGAFLALAIGKAAEYVIPPAKLDIIKRLDDDLVAIAGASPASEVSREVGKVARDGAEAWLAGGEGILTARAMREELEAADALAGRIRR